MPPAQRSLPGERRGHGGAFHVEEECGAVVEGDLRPGLLEEGGSTAQTTICVCLIVVLAFDPFLHENYLWHLIQQTIAIYSINGVYFNELCFTKQNKIVKLYLLSTGFFLIINLYIIYLS